MKVRKFFDKMWKEVVPEQATYAVENEYDDKGNLLKSSTFFAK